MSLSANADYNTTLYGICKGENGEILKNSQIVQAAPEGAESVGAGGDGKRGRGAMARGDRRA